MSAVDEQEMKRHRQESVQMHTVLRTLVGQKGKELSDFIAKSSLKSTNAFSQTSMEIVFETMKTIISIFNTSGPKTIGFDYDGSLPKYMVFADIFGQRCGYFSNKPTLIRELCSSFYGQVDAGFGNGTLIRQEIDMLAAKAEAMGSSILLVLSAPWGESIGDRFWKLCTVREDGNRFVDSEIVFSSMQRPPALQGSSVLESRMSGCGHAIQIMSNEWHAVNIDFSTAESIKTDQNFSKQDVKESSDSKMVVVMTKVIETLRAREKDQQARIAELESSQKAEVERRLCTAISRERKIWQGEIDRLQNSIDIHSYEVATERVRVDTLGVEIVHLDTAIIPSCIQMSIDFKNALSDVCGKQLLLEEELGTCNKKLASARKRDSEIRKERSAFESTIDAKSTELASLRSELEDVKMRAEEAKRTASQQLTSFLDTRANEYQRFQKIESDLKQAHELEIVENANRCMKTIENLKNELRMARFCARWVISTNSKRKLEADKSVGSAEPAEPAEVVEPTKAEAESTEPEAEATEAEATEPEATEAVEPAEHAEPAEATEAVEPAEPAEPAVDPEAEAVIDKLSDTSTHEKSTQTTEQTQLTEQTNEAKMSSTELLNIVASTKGLVAKLNNFVEKIQTGGGGGGGGERGGGGGGGGERGDRGVSIISPSSKYISHHTHFTANEHWHDVNGHIENHSYPLPPYHHHHHPHYNPYVSSSPPPHNSLQYHHHNGFQVHRTSFHPKQ